MCWSIEKFAFVVIATFVHVQTWLRCLKAHVLATHPNNLFWLMVDLAAILCLLVLFNAVCLAM